MAAPPTPSPDPAREPAQDPAQDPAHDPAAALTRLERRLARERAARAEAERAAEQGLRRLYAEQSRAELLRRVAIACANAEGWPDAAAPIARALVHDTGWAVAHVALLDARGETVVADAWASDDDAAHLAPAAAADTGAAPDAGAAADAVEGDGSGDAPASPPSGVGAVARARRTLTLAGRAEGSAVRVADGRVPRLPLVAAVGVPVVVDGDVAAVLEVFAPRAITVDDALTGFVDDLIVPIARLSDRTRTRELLEALVAERTRDLDAARRRAEAAVSARDTFLAMLSHGLRTPLHGALGLLDDLWARLGGTPGVADPQFGADLRLVRRTTDAATRLLDDLIDLSQLDGGKLALDVAPFALAPLIHEVSAVHAARAARLGTSVRVVLGPDAPAWVDGDAARVRQVVDHLVAVACERTDRGEVEIRVDGGDGLVVLAVRDEGAPLDDAACATCFDAWQERGSASARRVDGVPARRDLGLALAQQLARAMGGALAVTSRRGRNGAPHATVWTARLPLPASVDDAPTSGWGAGPRLDRPKRDAADAGPPAAHATPVSDAAAEVRPDRAAVAGRSAAEQPRILVCEADTATRRVGAAAARRIGARMEAARDLSAARAEALRGDFALLVLGVPTAVPDALGTTAALLAAVRAANVRRPDDPTRRVPILVLSALTDEGSAATLRAAGADEVVRTPVAPDVLAARLRGHLSPEDAADAADAA